MKNASEPDARLRALPPVEVEDGNFAGMVKGNDGGLAAFRGLDAGY